MTILANGNFAKTAAKIATVLFGFFMGAQLLLAVGVLPISIAWGGRQTELTLGLRVASVAAILILGVFIYIIRYRAGLLGSLPTPTSIRVLAWVVTGFMALNTLGNFASLSSAERLLFGPVTLMITAACLIVAASQTNWGEAR
jgi:hypothetical protein